MASRSLEIRCQPLTPIWTADADQKGGRLRETGLIGSLRWWYEAILRGLGFYACDPSTGSCIFQESSNVAGICLACQLFGCTGYSRRFRLEIDSEDEVAQLLTVALKNPANARHLGWRIPQQLTKPFGLRITALFGGGFDIESIGLTLRLIERFGALGAKTSQGQGVARFEGIPPTVEFSEWKASLTKPHKPTEQRPSASSLDEMVGTKVELAPQGKEWWKSIPLHMAGFGLSDKSTWIPSAPAVRSTLRAELRNAISATDRHRLMGTIRPNPKGSDVFVSHLYRDQGRWCMRIFGFVPRGDNAADCLVRELLAGGIDNELMGKLAEALGLPQKSIVSLVPYPRKVEDFFL